jgi:aryl-alcohol dehydrogenase-like predicted oxidoreductase
MDQMQRRFLGSSGVEISRVGLGGYELGPEPDEEPDVERATHVIDTAIKCGVNWIDTSENYLATQNEEAIGAALQGASGDFLIASKVAPGAGVTGGGSGFRRDQVLKACQASLKRLRRDRLDVYFLHWPDRTGVPLEETWGAMAELAEAGLVRALGLSNYEIEDVERCHRERPVDAVQVGLNLIDYLDVRASIATCERLGIAVTIFEPLASGILTGKTMEQVQATWAGPWRESPFYKRLLSPGNAEKSFAVANGLRPIAEALNATVAQVAIAWVLHQPGVTAAIAGSRNERHMYENARAAQVNLSSEVLEQVELLIPLGPTVATPAGS